MINEQKLFKLLNNPSRKSDRNGKLVFTKTWERKLKVKIVSF